jgi:hypothetical protein
MRMFNSLAIAAAVVATAALIPQAASAERVCRQDCAGTLCQERCVESDRTVGRGDRREERHDERWRERREERRDRAPGIELRIPGLDIGR